MNYVPIVLILAFVSIFVFVHQLCSTKRFNERFPPIDDDEFVRRCGPGVNREIAIRVRRIVSEQLGIEYERVYPEQRFVDDLDCG